MATIVTHPTFGQASARGRATPSAHRSIVSRVLLTVIAPAFLVASGWAMTDAVAYTQHSLLGLYGEASTGPVA